MSLKTSFFNKSLFKADMKRFWWLGLLETLFIYALVVAPVYNNCKMESEYIGSSLWRCMPSWSEGGVVILIIFAVCVPAILLSYMHFSASVSGYHALPVKRRQLLTTKLITGAILTFTPILINGIIFAIISAMPGFVRFFGVTDVIIWVVSGVLYTSVLFSLTTVVNMMTGNPIGTLVFTGGFALLPAIFISFFEMFFHTVIHGYATQHSNILKYIYIAEDNLMTFPYSLIYPAMTTVFLAGAYILYKKRKLENHGEVIAFTWLKPVFIIIVAMLASMLSFAYFMGAFNKTGVFYIIPVGLIGTIIAWMVSRKSLSFRGVLKPAVIYLASALVFCGIIHFDITGFENRIPDADEVQSASITEHNVVFVEGREVNYKISGAISQNFTNPEDIENVITLHKHMIESKDLEVKRHVTIPIEYKLKNGMTIKRLYLADYENDAEFLKPLYETKQLKARNFAIVNGSEKEYVNMTISDRRITFGEPVTLYPDNQYMQKLIEALQKDIEALPYEEFILNSGASTVINLEYKDEIVYDAYVPEVHQKNGTQSESYSIRQSYKNTIAVLKEMGFYDSLPTTDDFEGATVTTWTNNYSKYSEKDSDMKEVSTTDENEIQKLYSVYDSMIDDKKYTDHETATNISISYRLKSGNNFTVSCSYDRDKIPSELQPYL